MSDYKVPKGYVLISEDALREWGKLEEVREMCVCPVTNTESGNREFEMIGYMHPGNIRRLANGEPVAIRKDGWRLEPDQIAVYAQTKRVFNAS